MPSWGKLLTGDCSISYRLIYGLTLLQRRVFGCAVRLKMLLNSRSMTVKLGMIDLLHT